MVQEVDTLVEMGFSRQKAERALAVTNNKGVEPAMEWLLAHAEDPDPIPPKQVAAPTSSEATTSLQVAASSSQQPSASSSQPGPSNPSDSSVAKSIKCEDCGKLFSSQSEVEFHAAKTEHTNFCESTEEKKPLSEEEKKVMLQKLEDKMKQKRKEREEKEKSEELEKERLRIKSGKDMQDAKIRLQEMEMKKLIEQRKRDKLEEKKARDRVKAQIEADREARRLAAQGIKPEDVTPTPVPTSPPPAAAPKGPAPTSAKLQMKLPDGRNLQQVFSAKEQLSAVRLYLQINEMNDKTFSLLTTFPRKTFTDEDYEKPLEVLGLVPSAVIHVVLDKTNNP